MSVWMLSLLRQQPRRLLAVAMIGIAELQRSLRHSVKAEQQPLRLKIERRELPFEARLQRADVEFVVVIRRQRSKRGLPPHRRERRVNRIHRGRRRRRAILRIERRDEDALAPERDQVFDRLGDARIAVAHGEIDDHVLAKPLLQALPLCRRVIAASGEPSSVHTCL